MGKLISGGGRRKSASVAAAVLVVVAVSVTAYALVSPQPTPPRPPAPPTNAGATSTPSAEPGRPPPTAAARHESSRYRRPSGPVMSASAPVRVRIPALDVETPTIRLGLQDDGTMEVPDGPGEAGWYDRSPTPGELGPSVIAGHVTWDREPDVFFSLGKLRPGQQVKVARRDGSSATFEVTRVAQYPKKDFPTQAVYGNVDHAALRLITCGGVFDGEDNRYLDNVVVFGRLTRAAPS